MHGGLAGAGSRRLAGRCAAVRHPRRAFAVYHTPAAGPAERRKPLVGRAGERGEDGTSETWPNHGLMGFEKIKVDNPVVELDGDEMTRIMWMTIKEKLIFPFLDMDIDYYDLSITYRDETNDQVTVEAAGAIQRHHVGIKCATIIPDNARVLEFNLQQMWRSPTATIRDELDGTTFHTPIIIGNVPRRVPGWRKPIVLGMHAHGDQHRASQLVSRGGGTFKVAFEPEDGAPEGAVAHTFKVSSGGGVLLGMYSARESVESFARCCFEHALSQGVPLYLSTRSAVLREYDGLFVEAFGQLYQAQYKKHFEERGTWYQHREMDDMVAQVIRSSGGYVWACKNSDGGVLADLVAQGYGGPVLMTSALVCPDGKTMLTEAAHGTVTKHYRAFQRGEKTATNPIACTFAWTRGLAHRARLDGNERLAHFSQTLEEACINCVEKGLMTKDLALCVHGAEATTEQWLPTEDLIDAFAEELHAVLGRPPRPLPQQAQDAPFAERTEGLDRAS